MIAARPPGTAIPKVTVASLTFFCLNMYASSPKYNDVGRVLTVKQVLPPRKRARLHRHHQRLRPGAAQEAAGVDGAEADVPGHVLADTMGVSPIGGAQWSAD